MRFRQVSQGVLQGVFRGLAAIALPLSFDIPAAQAALLESESEFSPQLSQTLPSLTPEIEPPSQEGLPRPEIFEEIPIPEELFTPPDRPDQQETGDNIPASATVGQFVFVGSSVFSPDELAFAVRDYVGREITIGELFEVRDRITELYFEAGYVNTVAIIPPQEFPDGGTVTVQIVEGQIEEIVVNSPGRLRPSYVEQRLELVTQPPFSLPKLLEGLQLLQLDPLIQQVSAELAAGPTPGESLLTVDVVETDSSYADFSLDNSRSPSVGTFQQNITYTEANLLGNGERLTLGLGRSDGVWALDASYRFFLNPRNGTLQLSLGTTFSEVLEEPFDILDIESDASFVELTWRQPLVLTPTEEFALGLTASSQGSRSIFLREFFREEVGFPTRGADDDGRTRVTALRFFQEWFKQQPRQAIGLRSQFSLGLDILGATSGPGDPDAEFLSWRGQAQWVRLLSQDTLLVAQGTAQLAAGPLLPLEQLGLGGLGSVRGYRQDRLLVDNGLFGSVEVRFPLYRNDARTKLLQVVPFVDAAYGWNGSTPRPDQNALLSVGAGLLWQQQDRLTARLDFGLPLLADNRTGNSLQESGFHLSVSYRLY